MAGPSKQAPLETFLTSVGTGAEPRTPVEPKEAEAPDKAARRALVLTILDQANGEMNGEDLARRSELPPDIFRDIVASLQRDDLVVAKDDGFQLTARGRDAAQDQRKRLLSL